MAEINSVHNARVKEWAKLLQKKYRDQQGKFIIEEEHLIEEAVLAKCVDIILCLEEKKTLFEKENVITASQEVLNKLSRNASDCTCLAVCHKKAVEKRSNRVLLLDNIQDPGNLGTILRTAVSFDYKKVILSLDCCDVYNEKCIRSTQGALFSLEIIRSDLKRCIGELKQDGYKVIATALKNSIPLKEIPAAEKMAFIFGNEGQGIRQELIDLSDISCKIEMNSFESLNVAVASGIIMYSFKED